MGQLTNQVRNFSLAMLELNQAKGITLAFVGAECGDVAEDGCGVTKGVLAATDVGVSTVKKERSSAAEECSETGRMGSMEMVEPDIV